jgi:hypothetical protein
MFSSYLSEAQNSLHFQEPVVTAHSSSRTGLVRDAEAAERGFIFWRIGERPILQKPHGLVIELHEKLWTFDLPREPPGTNQKKVPSLRPQRLCGENFLLVGLANNSHSQQRPNLGRLLQNEISACFYEIFSFQSSCQDADRLRSHPLPRLNVQWMISHHHGFFP